MLNLLKYYNKVKITSQYLRVLLFSWRTCSNYNLKVIKKTYADIWKLIERAGKRPFCGERQGSREEFVETIRKRQSGYKKETESYKLQWWLNLELFCHSHGIRDIK